MNTWRYVEVLVFLLQIDHEGGFASLQGLQENNSYTELIKIVILYVFAKIHKVGENGEHLQHAGLGSSTEKSMLYAFSIFFHLILEKLLPLALQQESKSKEDPIVFLHPEGDRSSEGAHAASILYVFAKISCLNTLWVFETLALL